MRRGTTPTLTLTVDAELEGWACYVAIRSGCYVTIIEDDRLTVTQEDGTTTIELTLTQEETLALRVGACEIQVRAAHNGTALATDIARVDVGQIIQDGAIDG